MIVDVKVLSLISAMMVHSISCGGGGGHKTEYIHAEYPYHTHHQHHTEKIPEVKIVKVPVVKEIKIPHPYKVHYKVRVPYIVKQEVHTVPVHSHPIHTSEHIHHGHGSSHSSSHGHSNSQAHEASAGFSPSYGSESFGSGNYGSGFGGHGFSSHGASSNVAPMIISHTPVAVSSPSMFSQHMALRQIQAAPVKSVQVSSSQQKQVASSSKSAQQSAPQQNQIPASPKNPQNSFHSSIPTLTGLNTVFQASAGGFKTQGGGSYQVKEASADTEAPMFHGQGFKPLSSEIAQDANKSGSANSAVAYPYPLKPLHEKNPFEYSFGFSPSDPLYGF